MKTHIKIKPGVIGIAFVIALLIITDIAEAQVGGMHRRTRRRTAVVVSSATHQKDQEAQQQQEAAQTDATKSDDQEQSTQQTGTQGDHLPIGIIVSTLPDGCDPVVSNDVQYYHCGNDYYRTAYQGDNLVYVTTDPPN